MIGLLVPLRWWRGAGTPRYVDAPADRYVWAPPDIRDSVVAPVDALAVMEPPGPAVVGTELRMSVAAPDSAAVVPPDPRESTA